jgi:PhnB protein
MTTSKSSTCVQPYLFFEGVCDQALEFYKQRLGAEIMAMMRYKESPVPPGEGCPPVDPEKIMHAAFRIGETVIMASDGRCSGKPNFDGFGLSLTLKSIPDSERAFAALSEGGKVVMPLGKTFYSPSFGMVTDRFGVMWMVYVLAEGCA